MKIPAVNLPPRALGALRKLLQETRYSETAQLPAWQTARVYPLHDLVTAARQALGLGPPLPSASRPLRFHRAFRRRHPRTYQLYRLFFGHAEISRDKLALPLRTEELLLRGGLLEYTPEGNLRSRFQLTSAWGRYFLSSIPGRSPGEFVYLGDDSVVLGELVRRFRPPPGGRALDLCTGSGCVAMAAPERYSEVLGVDVNRTALALARANALLNSALHLRFAEGDLWEAAPGLWTLVTANPPYLPLPEPFRHLRHAYGGGELGTEVSLRIAEGLPRHLEWGGMCLIITFSPVVGDRDVLLEGITERLPADFSLNYRVLEEFAFTEFADYLATLGVRTFHYAVLAIRRDGRGRRRVRGPGLWTRLKRVPFPGLQAGPPVQQTAAGGAEPAAPTGRDTGRAGPSSARKARPAPRSSGLRAPNPARYGGILRRRH